MTIAALLRHHGVEVPRFVTVDGQVVLEGVTTNGAGDFSHVTFGSVTPVASHTFHGGAQELEVASATPKPWWDDKEQIARHIEAMEVSFPKFVYCPTESGSRPCWIGVIDTGRGKFNIAVVLRHDRKIPSVMVLGGIRLGASEGRRWKRAPHLYDNGNLCVADSADWIPEEHTAATVTAWTAHWLAAYTEWRMTRIWPVEGVRLVVA